MKAKIAAMLSAILVLTIGFAVACTPSDPSNVKMIFESNGGTAVQTIEQIAGSDVTEPAAPSRDGYTFEYWCSDQTLETQYVFGKMPENDITLYAKWKANTYTLTFELNGGAFGFETTAPANYTVGTGLTLPVPAARNGYDFGGWFTDAGFSGTAVTALSAADFGNKTYYAKWTPATYSIEYVLDGLKNHPDNPESYVFGTGAALQPAVNQGALGFMGWYDNAEFNGEAITAIDIDTFGDITLYAKVQEGVYSLEYDNLLGGTHSNPSYYVSENGLTLTDATRENYDFLGWFGENGEQVTAVASGTTGVIKLTAKWSATEFDIVLNTDGGEFDQGEAPASYTVEDDRTALPYPFKTGYAFVKWVDESGAEVTHFGGGNTGDIELTAVYLEQSGVEVGADGTVQRFTEAESKAIVIPDNAVKIPDHILYGDQTESADHDVTYYPESLFIGKASRLEYIGNFSFFYTENTGDPNWNPTGNFRQTTVNLPASLKYIGNYAFSDLPFDFTIPEDNSLEFIGGGAFNGTVWEENIPAEEEYVYFGKVLYKYQGGATEVNNIAADTVGIAGSAFESKTDITAITLPDGLRTIGDRAFAGCTGISEIHIPSSVTKVFYDLFSGWTAGQTVYLPFAQGEAPAEWDQNWAANTQAVLSYTFCNIVYVLNGGVNDESAQTQYAPGTAYTLPEPSNPGYEF